MSDKYLMHMMKRVEEYLIELIGHDAYEEFCKEIAKEAFRMEMEDLPESEFKDYVLGHFDTFTADYFSYEDLED